MQQQCRHRIVKISGHLDWVKFKLGLRRGYATAGTAVKRQRVPGHSECAKHKLELMVDYVTVGAAEKRHRMPGHSDWAKPTLGLRVAMQQLDRQRSAREFQAIQIAPNVGWD